MMNIDKNNISVNIGYSFKSSAILKNALTHRSYYNEYKEDSEHNERLEFLGDSILSMLVVEHLYKTYPDEREGVLSKYLAALVREEALAMVAQQLNFSEHVRTGKGCGISRSMLADAVEAVIGAIYLDGGYEPAKKFVDTHILSALESIIKENSWKDYKSQLNEDAQAKGHEAPQYETGCRNEETSEQDFLSVALISGKKYGEGIGKTKKEAEQIAAQESLKKLWQG